MSGCALNQTLDQFLFKLYMLTYFTPDILQFFAGQLDGYIVGKLSRPLTFH